MSFCTTCGDELHPERARKYAYCTKPACRERNATGLRMAAVGVNKAADQYVILDERTEREMAGGRYKKHPEVPRAARTASRAPKGDQRKARASDARHLPPERPAWSGAQQRLALLYRDMGMKPEQIARKLGVSPRLVTKILLAVPAPQAT
jgi:hypothetical protein